MKDLIELAQTLLQGLITWFFTIASPIETTTNLLAQSPIERRTRTLVLLLWSVVLTLLITSPISHLYGIELNNFGFYSLQIVLTFMNFVLAMWCIHVALRIFRLNTGLQDIVTIYTSTLLVYWPLFQIMWLPEQIDTYSMLSALKASGMPATYEAFRQLSHGGVWEKLPLVALIINIVSTLVWIERFHCLLNS